MTVEPHTKQEGRGTHVYTTDIEYGQTVQTGDGMLHHVENVELMVTIKPLGDTAAYPIAVPAHTLSIPEWARERES